MPSWFDSSEATGIGVALAVDVSSTAKIKMPLRRPGGDTRKHQIKDLQAFINKVDINAASLRLNLYKRARLASSFKLKLLEDGVDKQVAEDLTQLLITRLSTGRTEPQTESVRESESKTRRSKRIDFIEVERLLAEGNHHLKQSEYRKAVRAFQKLIELMPAHPQGLNGMGSALWLLDSYREAESYFRQAVETMPDYPDALNNLGAALFSRSEYQEAEAVLRRAIRVKPAFVDAQCNLGRTLIALGRVSDAEELFTKILRSVPGHAEALVARSQVAQINGCFDQAHELVQHALKIKPHMPSAWAELVHTRKMTLADKHWLRQAEEILASGISTLDEAHLRFAMGKYLDDLGDYERAFQSFKRANELTRAVAGKYEREARTRVVDDFIRTYSRQALSGITSDSSSTQPVFVVGMMRSGTSLVEQIIATHPSARGAGELSFWNDAFLENEAEVRKGILSESARRQLARRYLHALQAYGAQALRIVDKANVNSDYLGLIHSVLPSARFIYVQRHPIDTCLSCYFQPLSAAHGFKTDLSDLAHYCGEHQRLMHHWRAVLPPRCLLEVPYAELVADQEQWTRTILDFLGLTWHPQCLNFQHTNRPVKTASAWQVRQGIYKTSVDRWRNYERHIGPLRHLIGKS
jgi:tetratricopeptide (TPR) repeat protein